MSDTKAPQYSTKLDAALALVADAFRTHGRKASTTPYLAHLLQVMVTVAEHGGDEEQMIAALLHDYLEDIPGADAAKVEAEFGARVRHIVEALTDTQEHPKPPWEERKRAYLRELASEPADVKLVSAADKLHNASSTLRDHRTLGDGVFDRFTASKEQTLWYYRSLVQQLGTGWSHTLLDELREAVRGLHEAAGVAVDSEAI